MPFKPKKVIAFLTILMVTVGTASQAVAFKRTCPPGMCCCVSIMQAPQTIPHQGPHRTTKMCDEQVPCSHLNDNPLVNNLLPIALQSNPAPLFQMLAKETGPKPTVPDELNCFQPASNEIAIPTSKLSLYLQFSTILC